MAPECGRKGAARFTMGSFGTPKWDRNPWASELYVHPTQGFIGEMQVHEVNDLWGDRAQKGCGCVIS